MPWFDVKLRKKYRDEDGKRQLGEFSATLMAPTEDDAVTQARLLHDAEGDDLDLVSVTPA